MKLTWSIVLPLLLCALCMETTWAGSCSQEFNCNDVKNSVWTTTALSEGCTSAFGGFPSLQAKTQDLASQHLQASMKYLLFASHFSAWKYDREGFSSFFSKLSDEAFDDAVTIIKHMSKRGGKLSNLNVTMIKAEYEVSEIEALTKALDLEKHLANETIHLIHAAGHGSHEQDRFPDGEFAHFLSEEISEKHADRVQNLAVHVNNLGDAVATSLKANQDPAFYIYLYDTQFMK